MKSDFDLIKGQEKYIYDCPLCGGTAKGNNPDVFLGALGNSQYRIKCIPCNLIITQDRIDKVIGIIDIMRNQYIRFKNIPPNEKSGVYDGDLGRIRDEKGVSCYNTLVENDCYKIILPSISSGVIYDLLGFISQLVIEEIPAYLVVGNQVGTGTYGEPLIKDVKIIAELKFAELHNPKPKFKMDRTNPQLILQNKTI